MDNNCPYTIAIKQLVCKSYVNKRLDNVYTSTPIGTDIPLDFGYTLTLISGNRVKLTIRLSNPIYIPPVTFNVINEGYKVFDLPCECGTFRVYVAARLDPAVTACCIDCVE